MNSRQLVAMLTAEVGKVNAIRVLRRIRKRLKTLPVDQPMSENEFMLLVDDEVVRFFSRHRGGDVGE